MPTTTPWPLDGPVAALGSSAWNANGESVVHSQPGRVFTSSLWVAAIPVPPTASAPTSAAPISTLFIVPFLPLKAQRAYGRTLTSGNGLHAHVTAHARPRTCGSLQGGACQSGKRRARSWSFVHT